MPDTETPTTENTDTAPATEPAGEITADADTAKETPDGDLGDSGKQAIVAEREARKAAERQLREVQKSLKEYEDRDKTELQRALERADAAEKQATEAKFTALRTKVAASKGVPASSLTGATEDELIASADELIAWRDQNTTTTKPAAAPRRSGNLKSGASGNENPNADPKAAAAEALRRLRAGS